MKKFVSIALAVVVGVIGFAALEFKQALAITNDLTLAEPQPLVDNHEIMDLMIDPTYELLKDAAAVEPDGRKGWRALYVHSYAMGEIANLLFARNDQEYMATPEWDQLVVEMRKLCNAIAEATKAQDYPAVKQHYEALIVNCNACHTKFEPEDATEVKPW